jgi:ubiquinone/menaquinone biosynthesis C-methylase UbiE
MFSKQAAAYVSSETHALDKDLQIMVEYAEPRQGQIALDVATGPGNVAMAIASSGAQVIAIDLADGMLEEANVTARQRGLTNIIFQRGQSEALQFGNETFHLVVCRIAAHHFQDIPKFLKEVARVLKRGGRFVLEDSMAPEDADIANFLNTLEKTRDPTHIKSLSAAEWRKAVKDAGLSITEETVFKKTHDFPKWVSRTGRTSAEIARINDAIMATPKKIKSALFTIENGQVKNLHDEKLILLALKT